MAFARCLPCFSARATADKTAVLLTAQQDVGRNRHAASDSESKSRQVDVPRYGSDVITAARGAHGPEHNQDADCEQDELISSAIMSSLDITWSSSQPSSLQQWLLDMCSNTVLLPVLTSDELITRLDGRERVCVVKLPGKHSQALMPTFIASSVRSLLCTSTPEEYLTFLEAAKDKNEELDTTLQLLTTHIPCLAGLQVCSCSGEGLRVCNLPFTFEVQGLEFSLQLRIFPVLIKPTISSSTLEPTLLIEHLPTNHEDVLTRHIAYRDMMLDVSDAILTVCTFEGQVLQQNWAAIDYAGCRTACTYSSKPNTANYNSNYLADLLKFESGMLEDLMDEVKAGREWQCVVRVPRTLIPNGLTVQSLNFNEAGLIPAPECLVEPRRITRSTDAASPAKISHPPVFSSVMETDVPPAKLATSFEQLSAGCNIPTLPSDPQACAAAVTEHARGASNPQITDCQWAEAIGGASVFHARASLQSLQIAKSVPAVESQMSEQSTGSLQSVKLEIPSSRNITGETGRQSGRMSRRASRLHVLLLPDSPNPNAVQGIWSRSFHQNKSFRERERAGSISTIESCSLKSPSLSMPANRAMSVSSLGFAPSPSRSRQLPSVNVSFLDDNNSCDRMSRHINFANGSHDIDMTHQATAGLPGGDQTQDGLFGIPDQTWSAEEDCLWHEVSACRAVHPSTGAPVLVLMQRDVTERFKTEEEWQKASDACVRVLELIFPRHVIEHLTYALSPAVSPSTTVQSNTALPFNHQLEQVATKHESVTLFFCDIVGFTTMSKEVDPVKVMRFLNDLYTQYDLLADKHGVYKVETVGDCYVVAGGLMSHDEQGFAVVNTDSKNAGIHALAVYSFAQEVLKVANSMPDPHTGQPVKVRIGIHTGPVTSGVVGYRMPKFCLFGDSMNTASRMETTGKPNFIHVSQTTYQLLEACNAAQDLKCTGGVEVKGKGTMITYLYKHSNTTSVESFSAPKSPHLHSPRMRTSPRKPSSQCHTGATTAERRRSSMDARNSRTGNRARRASVIVDILLALTEGMDRSQSNGTANPNSGVETITMTPHSSTLPAGQPNSTSCQLPKYNVTDYPLELPMLTFADNVVPESKHAHSSRTRKANSVRDLSTRYSTTMSGSGIRGSDNKVDTGCLLASQHSHIQNMQEDEQGNGLLHLFSMVQRATSHQRSSRNNSTSQGVFPRPSFTEKSSRLSKSQHLGLNH